MNSVTVQIYAPLTVDLCLRVHALEGLGYKDAAGEDIIAIKDFMKKPCDRVPGASADLRQKHSVMQKVQAEHLRNAPYPVQVTNRSTA